MRRFLKDEDGAVTTVDWMVLTFAIIGLGVISWNLVVPGVLDGAELIDTQVERAH